MFSPAMSYEDFEIDDDGDDGDDDDESPDNVYTLNDMIREEEQTLKKEGYSSRDAMYEEERRLFFNYDRTQLTHTQGIPLNGHDYLKMVQDERKTLPAVLQAPEKCSPTNGGKKSPHSIDSPPGISRVEQKTDKELADDHENLPQAHSSKGEASGSRQKDSCCDSDTTTTTTSSSDPDLCQLNLDDSQAKSKTTKEMKRKLRLKSLGCKPLQMPKNVSSSAYSSEYQDLIDRDRILSNFLSLRAKIDALRGQSQTKSSETSDNPEADPKNAEKTLARSRRRANSLVRIMNFGHPPRVSELIQKSQMEIHFTLEILAEQCERSPIYSTLHADWIYSLISLLREPIEPDICSTLRRIAKLCINKRDIYEKRCSSGCDAPGGESRELVNAIDKEEYYASLLIVCIVRYHFGQADLK